LVATIAQWLRDAQHVYDEYLGDRHLERYGELFGKLSLG